MIEDEKPERDRLAVQDTRPNLILFIPYELGMTFGIGFFAIDTQTHSIVNGLLVVPFWILAALLVRRDINGARVFFVRLRLCMLLLDQHRWEGLSATPWPLAAREDRHAV